MAPSRTSRSFEAYWYGPEFIEWRTVYSGWYQVPILYTWNDVILEGGLKHETVAPTAPSGLR